MSKKKIELNREHIRLLNLVGLRDPAGVSLKALAKSTNKLRSRRRLRLLAELVKLELIFRTRPIAMRAGPDPIVFSITATGRRELARIRKLAA